MKTRSYFPIILLLFLQSILDAGYSPNLRLNSDLDAAVLRLSSRYGVPLPPSLSFQPINVAALRRFLDKADSLDASGVLSSQESYTIREIRKLFVNPRRVIGWAGAKQDKSCYGHVALLASLDPKLSDSVSLRSRWQLSPSLSGNIGNLSFYSGTDIWTDWWTDSLFHGSNYQPYNGIPYNLYNRKDSSHARSSDLPRGGIHMATERVELETAIDYVRIGPALFFPLLMSGTAPPIIYAKASWDVGPFHYMHMAGQLKSQTDKQKFIYLHRLNIPLWRNRIVAGINEAIVNGSTTDQQGPADSNNALRKQYYGKTRTWEWAYLIPFVPYKFSEHFLGDRDNAFMSFDVDMRYPRNHRFYGELLIDDMTSPWGFLSDDWGNKWAVTAGTQYLGSMRGKDVSATIEYSRVEPWVYTHFYGGALSYTHFGKCLGTPLGPNSDALILAVEVQLTHSNAVGLRLTSTRKNAFGRGGSLTDVFQDSAYIYNGDIVIPPNPDSPRKHFLGPGTVASSRLGVSWKLAPFGTFKIDALIEYDFTTGSKGLVGHAFGGLVF